MAYIGMVSYMCSIVLRKLTRKLCKSVTDYIRIII